jgi:hypothetical protein
MILPLTYWILTTAYGVYWCIKNPSWGDDKEYFTVMDVLAYIVPSMIFAPFVIPVALLMQIKFKRK